MISVAVQALIERIARSAERIADGLDLRNRLLEEANEMAREARDANRAIIEAARRLEEREAAERDARVQT